MIPYIIANSKQGTTHESALDLGGSEASNLVSASRTQTPPITDDRAAVGCLDNAESYSLSIHK